MGLTDSDLPSQVGGMAGCTLHVVSDEPESTYSKKKARVFGGTILAWAAANSLWNAGDVPDNGVRPVLTVLGGSQAELRALVANIQCGYNLAAMGGSFRSGGTKFEIMRSAGFAYVPQVVGNQHVVTIYHPPLFEFTPGDPGGYVRAIVAPAMVDMEALSPPPRVASCLAHLERHMRTKTAEATRKEPWRVGLAIMVARYVLQRCSFPMPHTAEFAVQLYDALTQGKEPLATEPISESHWGSSLGWGENSKERERIGYRGWVAPGIRMSLGCAVSASHADLGAVLAREVKLYMDGPAWLKLDDALHKLLGDKRTRAAVRASVAANSHDRWRDNVVKRRVVERAIADVVGTDPVLVNEVFKLIEADERY